MGMVEISTWKGPKKPPSNSLLSVISLLSISNSLLSVISLLSISNSLLSVISLLSISNSLLGISNSFTTYQ